MSSQFSPMPSNNLVALLVLTLEKHREGVWITRLVEELHSLTESKVRDGREIQVQVQDVERILHCQPPPSEGNFGALFIKNDVGTDPVLCQYDGIINRVSDAADPTLVKRTLALLQTAVLLGIPVFNGPTSYSLAVNKWCHHVLFRKAGLATPPTVVWTPMAHPKEGLLTFEDATKLVRHPSRDLQSLSAEAVPGIRTTPAAESYLIKPNAGGFGAGIVKLDGDTQNYNDRSTVPPAPAGEDPTRLVQAYLAPQDGCIYRVWFLCGRIQCAASRKVGQDEENGAVESMESEFTTGCVGITATCIRPSTLDNVKSDTRLPLVHVSPLPPFKPWEVPLEIQDEIETLLTFVPDAHAGSVEFLIFNDLRHYFDFNMLSTLPIVASDETNDDSENADTNGWPRGFNPWKELAKAVQDVILCR
jgi:hypothetical protein